MCLAHCYLSPRDHSLSNIVVKVINAVDYAMRFLHWLENLKTFYLLIGLSSKVSMTYRIELCKFLYFESYKFSTLF